jgi:hypothetical protein
MSISNLINNLPKSQQVELAIELIEIGIPIWNNYFLINKIEYFDSVVGLYHSIDKNLIQKSIDLSKKLKKKDNVLNRKIIKIKLNLLEKEIREPVVAREDFDFEIPKNVELILFSTSNLINLLNGNESNYNGKSKAYTSINQSIDAIVLSKLKTTEEIRKILDKYMNIK